MRPVFWPVLAVVSAVVVLVQLPGPHATAWHFFELGADLLVGSDSGADGTGLALYRDHPELQFGPLSIVVGLPFTLLPGGGEGAIMAVASALGLVVVWLLFETTEVLRPGSLRDAPPVVPLLVGVIVIVTWGDIAVRTAHIDDALALLAVVAAMWWVARERAVAATLALAFAAAAKPWAVVFIAHAAVPQGRHRLTRPIVAGGLAVATWAPFVVVEPTTLDASRFEIRNDPTTSLRALGFDSATTPGWVRPAQLIGGLAVVTLVVLWRRWPAGMLAGIAWRLLLDPGAHRYYTAGFVLGALLVELRARPGRVPWWTLCGAVVLELTPVPDGPVVLGQMARLATILGAFVAVARCEPVECVDAGARVAGGR